ncbi:hypothetical protein [Vibrio sp. 1180_3]|uniref:hypothetical protein n=1 Tax=Vibrio sp. 1180_3 TaxID=2528832 RepID=UPI002404C1AB|nr:hypothetical protein [Vibrio sp. 1180_3]MDF9399176.1 hypothetical protein [Vibrio sp. 1180_3]
MKHALRKLSDESKWISNLYRESDFESDLHMANKYKGKDFIWLDREHGSLLFPLKSGINPIFLSNYKDSEKAEWHFISSKGEIATLTAEEAIQLAYQSPLRATTFGCVNVQVQALLNDIIVRTSGLTECHIQGTEPNTWTAYLEWFRSSRNHVMIKVMNEAIRLCTEAKNANDALSF